MAEQPPPVADRHPIDFDLMYNRGSALPDQTTFTGPDNVANIRSLNFTHGPQLNAALASRPPQIATPSSADLAGTVVGDAGRDSARPWDYYGIHSGHPYGTLTSDIYPPAYSAPLYAPAGWEHSPTAPVRRRAIQACNVCRQRKVKCDEAKPHCQNCRETDQICAYKEAKPSKADRAQQELIEGQDIIKNELYNLKTELAELKYLLRASQQQNLLGTDALPPRKIDVGHSVGVHRLLRWKSIRRLLSFPEVLQALQIEDLSSLTECFVMQAEQRKGVLRVFGRGQGPDQYEGTACTWDNPSTPAEIEDPTSGATPSVYSPDVWGHGLGLPNVMTDRYSNKFMNDHPGGLNWNGHLRMDPATMNGLLTSYLENLHILHPFLSRTRLKHMFDRVRLQANPHLRPTVRAHAETNDRAQKRKLSTSASPTNLFSTHPSDEPFYECRGSTAIVLMVMALGKIYQSKQPLPGPVVERPWETSRTRSSYREGSPPGRISPSRKTSPASRSSSERHINQMRAQHDAPPADLVRGEDRNLDIIPGLAYYAKGAEILGTLQGGNELSQLQAMLLASLYCGQLASSIEAWSWLTQASRVCLFLMKDYSSKLKASRDPVHVQLIYFAYWTCYQLEGDILAELDLQPSGIEIPHDLAATLLPRIIDEQDHSTHIMVYYMSQVHLRKALNSFQWFLYPPDAYLKTHTMEWLLRSRYDCLIAIRGWRTVLSNGCQWDDRAYLTSDILDARLRAKYYGALYIINRPLLDYVLHKMPNKLTPEIEEDMRNYRDALPLPSDTVELRGGDLELYRACVECIDAAKRSTTAFDSIIFDPDSGELHRRLIVTNILGTAHAQFGNMLVLSATYTSHLGFMVEHSELVTLLKRTICFLNSHRPISYTLSQDADILEGILFNIDKPRRTTSINVPDSSQVSPSPATSSAS